MFDDHIRPKAPEQTWLDFTSYESQNDSNYNLFQPEQQL